ncbi:interferon-induced 35 kDa protein [Aplochiton taeniatus]
MKPKPQTSGLNDESIGVLVQFDRLIQEQGDLSKARDDQKRLAEEFRLRSDKLRKSMEKDKTSHAMKVEKDKKKLTLLGEEKERLKKEIQEVGEELSDMQKKNDQLKQQTDVSTAVPERKVVFTGLTEGGPNTDTFAVKPRIVYPMDGGTALITFEDEIVAEKILSVREHKVDLGAECTITLEARPVQLLVPSYIEMETKVCPRRILVSNLPKKETEDKLVDKLEIHFSKRKNGGGEVENADMLNDSGNVVITFLADNLAKGLTDGPCHEVEFDKGKKHRVKVTPFLNGEITDFQTKLSSCARTVLLAGIPDIMEHENLQDVLEIHFQKTSNGGGEVDAFLYNPLGQQTLALFEEDCPARE